MRLYKSSPGARIFSAFSVTACCASRERWCAWARWAGGCGEYDLVA